MSVCKLYHVLVFKGRTAGRNLPQPSEVTDAACGGPAPGSITQACSELALEWLAPSSEFAHIWWPQISKLLLVY